MVGQGVVFIALTACGRIGFDPGADTDGGVLGGKTAPITDRLTAETTCEPGPSQLILDREAPTGATLLVAFFMREPAATTLPVISGGATTWATDVSFSSFDSTNRRHISIFHAPVEAPIPAGTMIAIDHPMAISTGAAAFIIPSRVLATGGAPATAEGRVGAFTGSLTTIGSGVLCALVHHNRSDASFDVPFAQVYSLQSDCGGTRGSAGLHLAIAQGPGPMTCAGTLGPTLSWVSAMVAYDQPPLP